MKQAITTLCAMTVLAVACSNERAMVTHKQAAPEEVASQEQTLVDSLLLTALAESQAYPMVTGKDSERVVDVIAAALDQADTNGDGVINKTEHKRAMAVLAPDAEKARKQALKAYRIKHYDADGNGRLSALENAEAKIDMTLHYESILDLTGLSPDQAEELRGKFVARHDEDENGRLSPKERKNALYKLAATNKERMAMQKKKQRERAKKARKR